MQLHRQSAEDLLGAEISERDERDWIAAIRTGDASAFGAIFRAYDPALCRFVARYVRDENAAQELVHDLFLWIWEHRFEWTVPGPLRTYLFTAARNRAFSWLRHHRIELEFRERARRENAMPVLSATSASEPPGSAADLAAALERALARLPDRCREVFELNRRDHLSYADIAAVLSISAKTVAIHMGRALAALRRSLSDWRSD